MNSKLLNRSNVPTRLLWVLLALFLGMSSGGCTNLLPGSERLPLLRVMAPLPPGPACRVAVLPFINDTEYPLGEAIVGKVFSTQLNSAGTFFLVQEGDILKVYQQLHLLPQQELSLEYLQIVADRVDAQLLVTGIVMEMRDERSQLSSVNPKLIFDIQVRDGRSGEVLWSVFHRRQGSEYNKTMHFGTIHTMTGLSRQMAVEIINLWNDKGLTQCNEYP